MGYQGSTMNSILVKAVLTVGKKALPIALKSAKLVFDMANDLRHTEKAKKKVRLSKNLTVVENDLSVPKNYFEKQFLKISQDISDDLSVIKGQNEILFLSNSIEYFLKAHQNRTGLDQAISYSLQYDITAVINHIRDNPKLRFPGYMLHQCTVLAATIQEYNMFYDSILNDGHVKEWTERSVAEEMDRTFGPHNEGNPILPYMPYEYQLKWIRSNESSDWWEKLPIPFTSHNKLLDTAHDSLVILSKELIANEALEHRILEKLAHVPDHKIAIITNG